MPRNLNKKVIKGFSLLLVLLFLLFSINITAYATDEDIIDLKTAKELAVKNSRSMKNIDLTVEKAKYSEYIAENDYSAVKYSNYYTLLNEYFYLNKLLAEGDTSVEARIAALEKEIEKAKETLDAETINIANLLDKYEEAQAAYDDKIRAKEDFEKQLDYQVEQQYTNILQLESQIKLLEQTCDQKSTILNYERIKKEIGASSANINELAIEVSNVAKSIKYSKDKVRVLKREFNDLLGRDPEQSLQLLDFAVDITYQIPNYDELLSNLTTGYAKIPQMQRDIAKKKGDLDDANVRDDSNTIGLVEVEIKEKELALEEEKLKLKNAVSDLISDFNSKQETYQLAEISLKEVQQSYEWDKSKFEAGVISKMQLTTSAIQYQEALNSKRQAGYEYSLARQAVALAEQGILMGSQ